MPKVGNLDISLPLDTFRVTVKKFMKKETRYQRAGKEGYYSRTILTRTILAIEEMV